jgi:molecular chaperone DnaK
LAEISSNVLRLIQQHGIAIIAESLEDLAGQPASLLRDGARYQAMASDMAWNRLPVPLRVVGRSRLHWDKLLVALGQAAFETSTGRLVPHQDLQPRLSAAAEQFFVPAAATPREAVTVRNLPVVPQAAPVVTLPESRSTGTAGAIALGIDLGTTYSAVAYVDRHGRPCTIHNSAGELVTPSVVLFDDAGTIVGREARQAALMEPTKVAECVKRDMGAAAFRRLLNGESLPPEVISSFILRSLKADAERALGPVMHAVITVPAYFDEPRRRATMDAGRLAGFNVLDILNEPTAAAIAFGYQTGFLDRSGKPVGGRPMRTLVYDLGGGTFDVTIVEITHGAFKALATDGDVFLGGKDWDEKLVNLSAKRFLDEHRVDPRSNPVSLAELYLNVEQAKRTLSERPKATLFVAHEGKRSRVEITREEFEQATASLLGRTRSTTEIVVRQAGLTWANIDTILLVGGSTRMPMVPRMLEELSGKKPDRSVSPDEAVAHGAALYADLLLTQQGGGSGRTSFSVTNVNSHSLGIVGIDPRTRREVNHILIPKNSPLPHTVRRTFKTFKPNQRSVKLRVLEGESERPEACTQVGTCVIRGLPPNLAEGWPVEVCYAYEENGRLQVSAKLKGHSAAAVAEFERDNSLPENDLLLWAQVVKERSMELG